MQTSGTSLLGIGPCSATRVSVTGQDSRSVHGLLYLAAVWDDRCEQEHRQGPVDIDFSLVRYGYLVAWCRLPGICRLDLSLSVGPIPMLLWSTLVVSFSAASSSRSQVAVLTASAVACLTWVRVLVGIRRRTPMAMAMVTHLAT